MESSFRTMDSGDPGCFTRHIVSSVINGGLLVAMDTGLHNAPIKQAPNSLLRYSVAIYTYGALQCPMEAIHGRQSALHNYAAGGILGHIAVEKGWLSIPFPNSRPVYQLMSKGVSRPAVGGLMYGGFLGTIAVVMGKPL
mmetsp:Transcript_14679/g.17751  ORF Transcript_14679/g.17751 Transcript_14679/m.17751 type:complete len:139 (-) Transcript_14679:76-492(-)|eukprot:CAMPEP_0197844636 /NCGR_PEP_ID=MMETSP1438-20131217/1634_1 /TAXON_ID=1461541 /ORGANISM="Pterosperma sp., Strain CCMP1384" /LENGTH=138 /DNA_ID=CAMNT_0043455551 /DNA_START=269 /DNA_END=685 /DNA_ORIENTATION=-